MNAEDVFMVCGVIWGVCSVLVWIYVFIRGPDGSGLLYRVFAAVLGGFGVLGIILFLILHFAF